MKLESLVFACAGLFLGLLAGWLIGSHQTGPRSASLPAQPSQVAQGMDPSAPQPPPVLDEAQAARYRERAEQAPRDAAPRIQLGNLYFDAEQYPEAVRWYEQAFALDPGNADVSTDLGVSYYYTNQPDRALAQFQQSLAIDPNHTKTLLNVGIVRAFARQDLDGATRAWERVVELAPDSPEGRAARRALDSLRSAHPTLEGGTPAN